MRQLDVTASFVIRGTDSNGGFFLTREFIWPSCDSADHRRYLKLKCDRKAERMNKAGANVAVTYQELECDLWKDKETT